MIGVSQKFRIDAPYHICDATGHMPTLKMSNETETMDDVIRRPSRKATKKKKRRKTENLMKNDKRKSDASNILRICNNFSFV